MLLSFFSIAFTWLRKVSHSDEVDAILGELGIDLVLVKWDIWAKNRFGVIRVP